MKLVCVLMGAALLCAPMFASTADAATMAFTGIPQESLSNVWVEDGITATGSGPGGDFGFFGYFDTPDSAHMDDDGSSFPRSIVFTMAQPFDAVSFDILPSDNFFCSPDDVCGIPFDNISLTGVSNGLTVAQDSLYMGTAPSTYLFGADFSNLDSLIIALLFPGQSADATCINSPCTHLNIDNIALSPVPLPAGFVLFMSALALMGGLPAMKGRRSRSASAAA